MRSSMKHCISKRFNPLANQKPILFIPFSFAPPSLLSPNDKRGIKWTRVRHQQVRRGCRCRSVGRRCRMTTLAKSPCEVRKTAAAAAARMSPAPSPPPPPSPRGWMPLKSTVLNPFSTAHGRSERALQHLRPPQNPSATAAGRRVMRSPSHPHSLSSLLPAPGNFIPVERDARSY